MVEPTAIQKQIKTTLSTRQITLSPGQAVALFDATVYNESDRFASFQLRLLAAGMATEGDQPWYRLTPSVSSKIPSGDCTRFQVEVFGLPPIAHQFRGAIDLTVEVTSRDLENQSDRQPLRLVAEGGQGQPPNLALIVSQPQVHPGDRVALIAQVQNPTGSPLETTLRLSGLPERWFPDGVQQMLPLGPGQVQKVTFACEIPDPAQAPSKAYALALEASGRFPSVTAPGQLQILPGGNLAFSCSPLEQGIPELLGRWQNPPEGVANFTLQFDNHSNVEPGVQVTVVPVQPRRRWFWQREAATVAEVATLPAGVSLPDLPTTLPPGRSVTPLQIQQKLPWLGWARTRRFAVTAIATEEAIPTQDKTQELTVRVFPVVPLWQQALAALLALGVGTLTWLLLTDPGHRGPVNSVQFNGQGTEVLSGSADQTIRRWRLVNQNLKTQSRIGDLNKAVRVARYRPVNNDQVALGFENGEIQLANLLTGQRSRLTPDKDDRVFSLVFSRDARTLYSAHGSGLVLQWDATNLSADQTTPLQADALNFAIQTMALVGPDDSHLAIGGRYNRLLLMEVGTPQPSQAIPISKSSTELFGKPSGKSFGKPGQAPDPANPDSAEPPVDEAAGPVEPGTDTGSDTAASAEAQDNPQSPQDQKIAAKGKSNAGPKSKPAQKSAVQKSGAASVVLELPYPSGGSTDYISSLSVAEQLPSLLAIADTQGHISLWDSQACLERRGRCEAIDKPWLGHEGSPVRAVALSADGCFLASAADDGRVKLWALDGQGLRRSSSREGRVLAQGRKPLNAVDVIATRTGVWVTTGSDDGRVALHWVGFQGDRRADGSCPVLSGGGS